MNPESPMLVPGATPADLLAACRRESAPGLLPLTPFVDDRGVSLFGLMDGLLSGGQINVTTQYPGVTRAWHRHARQTDFWCVVSGMMKVGVMSDDGSRRWLAVIGEHRPALVVIPPGLWHGAATVGPTSATLLYYVDSRYNASAPDEQRQPPQWQWNPWPADSH